MVLRRLSKILHTSSATNPATLWLYSFPTLSDGRKWQRLAALDVGMREPLNRHPPLTKEPYNPQCIHLQHLSPSRLLRQVKRNPFKRRRSKHKGTVLGPYRERLRRTRSSVTTRSQTAIDGLVAQTQESCFMFATSLMSLHIPYLDCETRAT